MRRGVLVAAAIIAVSIPLLLAAWTQSEEVAWIVSVTPQDPYVRQPVTFKAYSYSPVLQRIHTVTCLLTLRNSTDVIWFARASGSPATYTFSLDSEGSYILDAVCADNAGHQYSTSFSISVRSPTLIVEPADVRWGRPLKINVYSSPPYSGATVTILYRGSQYTATLVNGRATVVLPPIYGPETVTAVLFGAQASIDVTPPAPSIVINASNTMKNTSAITVALVDDLGVVDVEWPVNLIATGSCIIEPRATYYTNNRYTVIANRSNPFAVETCTMTASVSLWSGSLNASAEIKVLPVYVVNASLQYVNTSLWDYTFTATAEFDEAVNGSLVLFIDGIPVASVTNTSRLFVLQYSARFTPGLHVVSAVFIGGAGTINIGSVAISAPIKSSTYLPPNTVYAGETIELPSGAWYVYRVNKSTIYVIAYYPYGYTAYRINIVYPTINLTEKEISIYNAAPGATVKVYCGVKLVAELYLSETNTTWRIPFDCDYVVAVYTYKQYTEIVYVNEPVPIELAETCMAGEPCVIVPSHPKVLYAEVNGITFKAGESVRLPAGYYTVKVYTADGLMIERPLTVVQPRILVVAYLEPGVGWRLRVYGPETAVISVALKDGRVITVKPGEYILYAEPVSAYWGYGSVEFVRLEYLQPPKQ